jgi:enoyl-CoA hydratase
VELLATRRRVKSVTATNFVCVELDDHKRNALGFDLIAQIHTAVERAVEVRQPLVIEGRPGTFSAGFDLKIVNGPDPGALTRMLLAAEAMFRAIVAAPVPVIAACTGHALGAGALLLLAADYRIGLLGDCRIGFNELQIDLALPDFATELAAGRLALQHLCAATLFAKTVDSKRAVEVGFLDEATDEPVRAARGLATEMAAVSMTAFAISKTFLRHRLSAALQASTLLTPAGYPW